MRTRPITLLILLGLTITLAACGSNSDNASSTSTIPQSTTSSSSASTSTTKGSSTSSTHCATDQLKGSIGESQSGAGQRYTALVLTNTGSKACELRGFPGVSLLDSSARQIGQPATREGSEGATVTLAPGGSASATLHTSAAGLGPSCEPVSAQIKVFPPDNTAALTIAAQYTACGGFRVSTLVPGTAGN